MIEFDPLCSRSEQSNWSHRGANPCEVWRAANHLGGNAGTVIRGDAGRGAWSASGRKQREASAKIGKVITHLFHTLNEPVRMSALSRLAGISNSHFYHLFKLATGQTPNGFFIRARMCRAGRLLRETNLSVKEIAAGLGYDDQFYFSRLFKSVNGVPPRSYRALAAEPPYSGAGAALMSFEREFSRTPPGSSSGLATRTGRRIFEHPASPVSKLNPNRPSQPKQPRS